ncbi:flagellar protein FlgN [Halonatronum saccharophilum]|uniref:flagellar protein FlgN n=1 Tax=Halonatronum saccharophilum TaxID=150060 RepID=UPI0004843DB7|nr:flagellar protein FlgN [Halonatronum saccharophilum]
MNSIDIAKLIDILEAEISLYQKLYELGEEKKDSLLARDIGSLEDITKEEEGLLVKVERLEKGRQGISGDISLTQLLNQVKGEERTTLKELQRDLVVLMDKFIDLNDLNNKLIKDSLQLTNFNLNLLNSGPQGTYGKKGEVNDGERRNMIINKKA